MSRTIRRLTLSGSPEARGALHGQTYADSIRVYAQSRVKLSTAGTRLGREDAIDLATRCLPHHEQYAPDLHAELLAMCAAAGISPAEGVIVGGYTDFLDVVRAVDMGAPIEDTCTAALVPSSATDGLGGLFTQTWDMHASATPHVVMLRHEPEGGLAALTFTTVGCLGQIGMNEAGICVGINDLSSLGGRLGVTWPFVVRKVLQQDKLDAAVRAVVEAPLAGGHNYQIMDRHGAGVNIEWMPGRVEVTPLRDTPIAHSNHCVLPTTFARQAPRPEALQRSSLERLRHADALLSARPITVEGLMDLTRDETWICRHPDPPFEYETCGAVVMRPATGRLWAVWGRPSEGDYEAFDLGGA